MMATVVWHAQRHRLWCRQEGRADDSQTGEAVGQLQLGLGLGHHARHSRLSSASAQPPEVSESLVQHAQGDLPRVSMYCHGASYTTYTTDYCMPRLSACLAELV
jgi:hypothetical protein